MPHRLLIRLFADGAAEWLAQARDGAVLQGPQAGLPDAMAADEVVLLLPAEDVLLLEAPRIGRSAAQLAQALPFAIEEQLVAPVESQHVAFDERAVGDSVPVAVIDRARLDAALARLREAGLSADRGLAESQLLPHEPPTVFADGERLVLRWQRSAALVADRASWPELRDWLAGLGIHGWHGVGELRGLDGIEPAAGGSASLAWLASRLAAGGGPNLLQGDYRPAQRRAESAGRWRWAAGLAALAVALALTLAVVERVQLERQVTARQQEMEQLLRHAVPGVQRIVDPVAQLRVEQQRLGQRNGDGALPLLATVAPVLAGSGRYTVEAIEYRADTLDLVVTAADVAALDSLRERLSALPPLQVELTAATPGSRGVEGRLRIRGGQS